jgi:hypothetical protein
MSAKKTSTAPKARKSKAVPCAAPSDSARRSKTALAFTSLPAHYLRKNAFWAGRTVRASASDTGLTAARVSASG